MALGMSRDEYWNGNVFLPYDYIEADAERQKRFNNEAWWQGMYFYDALSAVASSMNGKSKKYTDKPYEIEHKELTEDDEIEQAEAYMSMFFSAGKNWGKGES